MINEYKNINSTCFTKYIEVHGLENELVTVEVKPYDELLSIFGLDSDGYIHTPWTTVREMQRVFERGGNVCINVPQKNKGNTRTTDDRLDYRVAYGGWGYPSSAFNVIDSAVKMNAPIKALYV